MSDETSFTKRRFLSLLLGGGAMAFGLKEAESAEKPRHAEAKGSSP